MKYGLLTVNEIITENNRKYAICSCDCGKTNIKVRLDNLKGGHTKSCGCQSSRKGKNLLGKKFNHLTVIEKTNKRSASGSIYWRCQCDCGNNSLIDVDSNSLLKGATQSCGCLTSKGEEKIAQLLSQYNIPFEKQKIFKDCCFPKTYGIPRFDFFVNNKYIIEYDGIQHFENITFFNKNNEQLSIKEKDDFKNQWCKEHNIPIIRVNYQMLNTLTIDNLLLKEELNGEVC